MSVGPLILDTGGWLYALAGDEAYAKALKDARPAIVPGLVLAEVDWHLRKRREDMARLLREVTRCSTAMAGVRLSILSTSGFSMRPANCRT